MADTAPASASVRRAATLPTRLLPQQTNLRPAGPRRDQPQTETLFACAFARIFSYSPSQPRLNAASGHNGADANRLPWKDPLESSCASGPLRIYRLLQAGDACFLNSGSLILSLMPRSQCWCVDGAAKFAGVFNSAVYRIELPFETDAQRADVENFKSVLGSILRYEKTACLFQRGFGEDLPEDNFSPTGSGRQRGPVSQARKWAYDEGWRPGDVDPEMWRARNLRGRSPAGSDEGSRGGAVADEMGRTRRRSPQPAPVTAEEGPSIRPLSNQAYRSFTMPHKYNFEQADPFYKAQARATSEEPEEESALLRSGGRVHVQQDKRMSVAEHVNGFSSPLTEEAPILPTNPKMRPVIEQPADEVEPRDMTHPQTEDSITHQSSMDRRNVGQPVIIETPAEADEKEDVIADATPGLGAVEALRPAKHVRIEEPTTPASSAPSEDATFADDVTDALQKHHLKEAQSMQSFHTTRTGLSPKPSMASFKPALEVIEADDEPTMSGSEPFDDVQTKLPPLAEDVVQPDTKEAEIGNLDHAPVPQTLPLDPPPDTQSTPKPRRLRPLSSRASQSLISHSMRRQPSLSFITREGNEPPPGISTALISHTVSLLSGPPAGLLAAMVQIAARIARGALGDGSAAFRYREGKTAPSGYKWMPGGWESDEDEDWEAREEEVAMGRDDEDDYGVALGCDTPSRRRRRQWSRDMQREGDVLKTVGEAMDDD